MTRLKSILLAVVTATAATAASAAEPALYVYSTIDALLAGAYDGDLSVGQLATKGDFGLGTYNHLDGEMILLDGISYHAKADGTVVVAGPDEKVPLAYVLPFKATDGFGVDAGPARSLAELERLLDARLSSQNLFHAVKVHGTFQDVSTRAIKPQKRPYRPLAEVSKTQSVFEKKQVVGTLIGLRSPAFSRGFSVVGWHWHFVSDDRAFGGHVLAARFVGGTVGIASVHQVDVDLPTTSDFATADQAKDRAAELHQVETGKR